MISETINELLKFSNEILTLGYPINDDRIELFENKYKVNLPNDYKYFIRLYNGVNLMGVNIFGIGPNINDEMQSQTLESIYDIEHFEVAVPQYSYLVPFSPDGGGNFYCFDTRVHNSNTESCPIVFWVSNYQYNDKDEPEVTNESFDHFLHEVLIEWTLREYDYDGNEKEEDE